MADSKAVEALNALATYLAGEITTDNGYSFDATNKVFVGKQQIDLEQASQLPQWVLFGMSGTWQAKSINQSCTLETMETVIECHAEATDIDDAHVTALNLLSETAAALRAADPALGGKSHDLLLDGANWELFFNQDYNTVVAVFTFQLQLFYQ